MEVIYDFKIILHMFKGILFVLIKI